MTVTERIAYLKGLAEGLELNTESKEGKVIAGMLEALEDIAMELTDMTERIDVLDEDLADVEDIVYDDDDFDFDLDDNFSDEDEEDDVYEFECPNCHETVYFDDSLFDGDDDEDFELECPACGAKLDGVFEFEDEGDEE
ncbi:MAG: hypothetical protein IJT27_00370 [Clostridia bacterium]|nr:hypothetical protein [Clostridia bacterium]